MRCTSVHGDVDGVVPLHKYRMVAAVWSVYLVLPCVYLITLGVWLVFTAFVPRPLRPSAQTDATTVNSQNVSSVQVDYRCVQVVAIG